MSADRDPCYSSFALPGGFTAKCGRVRFHRGSHKAVLQWTDGDKKALESVAAVVQAFREAGVKP